MVSDRFFSLIVKAIGFSPITDIRRFVHDYLLDPVRIDIGAMRRNLQHYQELEHMAATAREKVSELQAILELHDRILHDRRAVEVQECLIRRAAQEAAAMALDEAHRTLGATEADQGRVAQAIESTSRDIDALRGRQDTLRRARDADQAYQLLRELGLREEALTRELSRARGDVEQARRAATAGEGLVAAVRAAADLLEADGREAGEPDEGDPTVRGRRQDPLAAASALFTDLARLADDPAGASRGGDEQEWRRRLAAARSTIAGIADRVARRVWETQRLRDELSTRQQELRTELERLRAGERSYPPEVTALRDLLARHLAESDPAAAAPRILCELLEIPDEAWQDAIEGFLDRRRFDLIVDPPRFADCLRLYERHRSARDIHGVGLVDSEGAESSAGRRLPGSLAEEVHTDCPWARGYVDLLLGDLMKCEGETELNRHRRAITRTCMTYVRNAARRIDPRIHETPFIGSRAVPRQIERATQALRETEARIDDLERRLESLSPVHSRLAEHERLFARLEDSLASLWRVHPLQEELKGLAEQKAGIDRSALARLEGELNTVDARLEELQRRSDELREESGRLRQQRRQDEERVAGRRREGEQAEVGLAQAEQDWPQAFAAAADRYPGERARLSPPQIVANFRANQATLHSRIEGRRDELVNLQGAYNVRHQFDGRLSPDSAADYLAEHHKLTDSELPDYEQRISRALKAAEQEFQEHFVHKLREAITNARQEFDYVNAALREITNARQEFDYVNAALREVWFGRDRYQFLVTKSAEFAEYYDMVNDPMLLQEGYSLFSEAFSERHRQVIEDLFQQVAAAGAPAVDSVVSRLTDYRNYLDYDIRVTGRGGETQLLSKVAREKSGGETQTPYYVAIVASFARLYRLKEDHDTIRLVMFDEAFNRMDWEHIETSLEFLAQFDLQVLLAATTDRCEVIQPHVDTVLLVQRDGRTGIVDPFVFDRRGGPDDASVRDNNA